MREIRSGLLLAMTTWTLGGAAWAASAPVPSPGDRLAAIHKLANDELPGLRAVLARYGGKSEFADEYEDATQGILDALILEWPLHGQLDALAEQETGEPKLLLIHALLGRAAERNASMLRRARTLALSAAHDDNALSAQETKIALYQDLEAGLGDDEAMFARIATLTDATASL